MKYTIKYFIKKFSAIPRNKWCMEKFHNPKKTKFCALGHCGETNDLRTEESRELRQILSHGRILLINDGELEFVVLGKHPRTRIVNALKRLEKGLEIS